MTDQHWVAGHLTGGLGNRLFQHAAAAGLAETLGRRLVFHVPSCAPTEHGAFGNIFQLFPDVPVLTSEEETSSIPEPPGCVFTYCPFPSLEFLARNLVIDGWRQSPLYFPKAGIHAKIETLLSADQRAHLLSTYGLDTLPKREQSWFVHIRLGDYLILPHHQINIGAYYKEAVQHIPTGAPILLFSDQAKDYKDIFTNMFRQLGHTVTVVTDVTDEIETLYLMSQCWAGAIVANSTFSWWGAYFARQRAPHPEQYKGVYPTCWGQGLPEARDLLPSWSIRVHTHG